MTSDVLVLEVIDLSTEDAEIEDVPICIPCLRREGMYCNIHHSPELVINDPSQSDDPDDLCLFSACLECSRIDAESLPAETIEQYRNLLTTDCPQAFFDGIAEIGVARLQKPISNNLNAAFAVVIAARLYGATFDQAVTGLVMNAYHSTTRH